MAQVLTFSDLELIVLTFLQKPVLSFERSFVKIFLWNGRLNFFHPGLSRKIFLSVVGTQTLLLFMVLLSRIYYPVISTCHTEHFVNVPGFSECFSPTCVVFFFRGFFKSLFCVSWLSWRAFWVIILFSGFFSVCLSKIWPAFCCPVALAPGSVISQSFLFCFFFDPFTTF